MKSRCIVGNGDFLEFVFQSWKQARPNETISRIEVPQHEDYSFDLRLLDDINPAENAMFIAIDERFGNFKRMELMQAAMERGFKLEPFIHSSAALGFGVVIGLNVFIGAKAVIEFGSRIDFNTVVHSSATIGAHSRIKASSWIESGVQLGTYVEIGAHCIVRMGASVLSGVKVGKNCELGWPKVYSENIPNKTAFDMRFDEPILTFDN